ncbi:hypothetical protein ROHU_001959 [Labeo rohita]|uniref:Uncharacterized protein n=1 Tax=Labeo rohita TaxID=84645 RepID=A0A498NZ14_LABRO|nr:hypothetical protein ROHU_007559 [Labeo rohita]RXN37542.1 hypothetical protein ROHU_001959 [Labeo rohita]
MSKVCEKVSSWGLPLMKSETSIFQKTQKPRSSINACPNQPSPKKDSRSRSSNQNLENQSPRPAANGSLPPRTPEHQGSQSPEVKLIVVPRRPSGPDHPENHVPRIGRVSEGTPLSSPKDNSRSRISNQNLENQSPRPAANGSLPPRTSEHQESQSP